MVPHFVGAMSKGIVCDVLGLGAGQEYSTAAFGFGGTVVVPTAVREQVLLQSGVAAGQKVVGGVVAVQYHVFCLYGDMRAPKFSGVWTLTTQADVLACDADGLRVRPGG